jgi:hypothetical protein
MPITGDQTAILATRSFWVFRVPWSSTNTLPDNTLAWGTTWGTPSGQSAAYVHAGYTIGGLDFSIEITRAEIRVDQEVDPVLRPVTGRNMSLRAQLAEVTPANIAAAAQQGTFTAVAATTAARGYNQVEITSTVAETFQTVGFDILGQDNEPTRIIAWKTQPSGAVNGQIRPTEAATIALDATCYPDTSVTPARILTFRDITPIAA